MIFPRLLLEVFLLLKYEADNTTYLVGGCVRDTLMFKIPKDYDIVTDVPMSTIKTIFLNNNWKVSDTGKTFFVLNVSKEGKNYEIANFRKDIGIADGRRPEKCEIGDMSTDSQRRDFTINSIYYDPMNDKFYDPVGGLKDLNSRILKFIGKPSERIREDYLRVFRFYRFITKGFTPDKKSLKACRALFTEAYTNTTPERVRMELEKIAI